MSKRWTTEALRNKVNWEGGVFDTIVYGIDSDDIEDPTIASLWSEAQDLMSKLLPLVDNIEYILDPLS